MERNLITGIAYDKNEARITLSGLPVAPGTAAAIFGPLAEGGINYDMIAQGSPTDLTFTVPAATLAQAADILEKAQEAIGYDELPTDTDICKVSIVGVGIRSDPALAAKMFATLADRQDRHPRHRHLGDQGLGADSAGPCRARRARAAHRLRAGRGGRGLTLSAPPLDGEGLGWGGVSATDTAL